MLLCRGGRCLAAAALRQITQAVQHMPYFISSLKADDPKRLVGAIRAHWAIGQI